METRFYVIIPARWGSTRFPGKPLVDIGGKPMIQWVVERAGRAPGVQGVTVATDDEEIMQAVAGFGGEVIMTPTDLRTGSDRVAYAARKMRFADDSLIVNVQGDQPLISPELITETAEPLVGQPELPVTTPVTRITKPEELNDPTHVKVVMNMMNDALYFSRLTIPHPRDGQGTDHYKHLGVYVFRNDYLQTFAALETGVLESIEKLEQLRILEHGDTIRCVITRHDSPEIDRPDHIPAIAEHLKE